MRGAIEFYDSHDGLALLGLRVSLFLEPFFDVIQHVEAIEDYLERLRFGSLLEFPADLQELRDGGSFEGPGNGCSGWVQKRVREDLL